MSRYTSHLGNNRRLGLSLTGTGKKWHVVTTYRVNTDKQPFKRIVRIRFAIS